MSWAYPLFFTGLIALAGPVLVHLLMKAQGRKVPFSTLRFFTSVQGTREKKKIRHWLLLLMRLLILALLVAAFARPFRPAADSGSPAPQRQRAVVMVLDRSASMQASDQAGGSRWDAAVLATRKILRGLSATDRAAIVGDAETAEIEAPWTSPGTALEALAHLEPTNEAGRLADGLQLAGTLLDHAPAGSQRELILVSDLQKSGCQDLDSVSLPAGTHYEVKAVANNQGSNLAIADLIQEGTSSPVLKVRLRNYSPGNLPGVPVAISVDQQPFSQMTPDIGRDTGVALPTLALPAGWHDLKLEIKRTDALALDNQFYAAVRVPQSVTVLVAEPRLEEKNYRRSSYFVTSALDPAPDTGEADSSFKPFAVTVVGPEALAGSLASTPPQVIVLPPLAEIPKGLGAALKNYVEQGGGLLVWGGPDLDLLGYNAEFGDFLPAHFAGQEANGDAALEGSWRLGWWKGESSLFQMFQKPGHGDLTLPKFHQRLRLDVNPGAEVLATFEDKTPFLLAGAFGRGRVLVVNSGPDTHGSDWPTHKTFLPLVDQMTLFLAGSGGGAAFLVARSLAPTRNGEFALGADHANEQVQVVKPDGKLMPARADEAGALRHLDCEQPGPLQKRNPQNEAFERFCVNFPAAESNLEGVDAHEIAGTLRFRKAGSDASYPAGANPPDRRELWPWLMAFLMPLLFLELTWANRSRA